MVISVEEKPSLQALERKTGHVETDPGKIVRANAPGRLAFAQDSLHFPGPAHYGPRPASGARPRMVFN